MTLEARLKELGWDIVPTGPEEWEWLKFNGDEVIAREGDDTWWHDRNVCINPWLY